MVHEWAKLRCGMNEEHGYPGDSKFPMFYLNSIINLLIYSLGARLCLWCMNEPSLGGVSMRIMATQAISIYSCSTPCSTYLRLTWTYIFLHQGQDYGAWVGQAEVGRVWGAWLPRGSQVPHVLLANQVDCEWTITGSGVELLPQQPRSGIWTGQVLSLKGQGHEIWFG